MDSRIISIEHDQLDAACTEISEHVRQIDAELDRLEAAADALSWHGQERHRSPIVWRSANGTSRCER